MTQYVNLATNPKGVSLTNWTVLGASGSGTTFATGAASDPLIPYGLSTYVRLTMGTGATSQGGVRYTQPVTPGVDYSFGASVRTNMTGGNLVQFRIVWFGASGVEVAGSSRYYSDAVALDGSTKWGRIERDATTAPAGAAYAAIDIYAANGTAWTAGSNLYITALTVIAGDALPAAPYDYFDGDTDWSGVNTFTWQGGANTSASVYVITAAPVAQFTGDGTTVQITADSLAAGTVYVTLYRYADGLTSQVRSVVKLYAAGGFTAIDNEAPVGIPVRYRAMQYTATGGTIGYTQTTTVTVPAPAPWIGLISDPLDQSSTIQVVMTSTAGTAPQRPIDGTVYQIGATAVVLAGPQSLITGLDMGFYTQSDDDDQNMIALLQQTHGVILIRTPPGFGGQIPRALYCFAGGAYPTYLDGDGSLWTNVVSQVTSSTLPVSAPAATWADYIDAYGDSWVEFDQTYSSWLDAEANPPTEAS